jgi:hypothetical protein
MTLDIRNILELYMFPHLNQFENDKTFVGLLDILLTDLIPGIGCLEDFLDFTGVNEVDSLIIAVDASAIPANSLLFNI